MNSLLHWLTSPEWALVVKALLHSLWQGALIAGALALLLRRVGSPVSRYRLALSGLGVLLLATVVTWGVLNAPTLPAPAMMPAPVTESILPPAAPGPVDRFVVAANWTPAKPQTQWTAWLALAWLLGAGVMLGRASVKIAGAEQLRRSCQPINDPRIAGLVAEARRAVQLTRQIRVAVTSQLTSPAVVGVIVPTLILPLSLITTLSHEQLRFILLHELAHIRRGDYLANLFQLFAEALLFFNPAVWWLSHQVRREREACCDALAIELSGAPADYARTLVSVAETILNPSPAAAPAFGNDREPSSLADRVQRVLVPGYRPSLRLTWRAMIAALLVGSVLLGLLAAGTRSTVAATAALLEPKTNAARTITDGSTDDVAYRRWQYELALVGQTNRKDSVAALLREIEESPFMEAFAAWRQVNKAAAEQRGTNATYSMPGGGVTDPKTGRFIPSRLDALQCRLGQEAHLHESFLVKELVADADIHQILESSPQLCEKYGIHSLALVLFIPGRGYISKSNSGWSPQAQQSLWLKAMTNASSPIGNPANGSQLNNVETPELLDARQPASTAGAAWTGSQTIVSKLGSIRLERVEFENTLLSDVTRFLAEEARTNDPANRGLNFIINPGLNPSAASPAASATSPGLIQSNVLITIRPAMQKATLGEVLGVIVRSSSQPITYSVEDYGIVIKPADTNTSAALHTRTFKVSELELARLVGDVGPVLITNTVENLQRFMVKAGFDRQLPGRALFLARVAGLYVRGTAEEIARVEAVLAGQPASSPEPVRESLPVPGRNTSGPGAEARPAVYSDTNVFTRTFKVDPNTFVTAMESAGISKGTNGTSTQAGVVAFFKSIGLDYQPPKAVFFNDRTGQIFVRATLSELDAIESALQVVNSAPPQVNIRARFVEVPQADTRATKLESYSGTNRIGGYDPGAQGGGALGYLGIASTNLVSQPQAGGNYPLTSNLLTGILTPAQFKVVLRALEQREGVETLSSPSITTLSGRQAQIQIMDMKTIVTGIKPVVTNGVTTNVLQTAELPFGPTLDVIPYVSADGYTVQMTMIPSLTEFLGYDKPDAALTNYGGVNALNAALPLPHYRVRQTVAQANVWDGQTIVIGGLTTEIVTRHPDGSTTKVPDPTPLKKQLFIFITPTIIDPAGNRVHADEEMPFSTNTVPRQPGK